MIRILQVVNIMDRAGIENVLMNYYRHIDKSQVQFDFLTHRVNDGAFDEEIKALGGKIYKAPRLYPQNYPAYFAYMKKFFKEHPEYQIVHSHIDAMSYLPLLAAKKAGIPIRISHSHNTNIDKDYRYILKQCFRAGINSVANLRKACSRDAGKYLFGKEEFQVIPNALDTSRFLYDSNVRCEVREELGITDKFVIGHVGRFTEQKNHAFIIELFEKVAIQREDAVLVLVGNGELKESVQDKVREKGLEDRVFILENRSDIQRIYQALDVFIFPSLYEGLGLVLVEAQISGLPCLVSVYVPEEAKISENMQFLELDVELWTEHIVNMKQDNERQSVHTEYYDIHHATKELETMYMNLHKDLM